MLVFGGRSGLLKLKKTLDDLWEFDLDNHEWKQIDVIGAKPIGRHSHSACAIHNKLMVIFGGSAGNKKSFNFLNDCWILDTDTYIWHEIHLWGDVPEPRVGCVMENIGNGFIFIHGGLNKNEFNNIFIINTANSQGKTFLKN
jgi:N-acetylneuraminic acid mutarotase